jgi:excinuclease ABC subunit B
MKEAARALEFERAALLRDQVIELRRTLAVEEPERIVPREFQRTPTTTRAAARAERGRR